MVSSYWGAIFINTRSMVKWLRRLKDTPQKKWRPSDINYIETSRLQKYQEAFKISQWVTGEVSPRRDRTLNLQVFFNIDYYWLQGKTDMLLYTRQGQLPLFANMPLWSDTKSEWMWEEIWIYMYRKESEFDYQNRTSILEIFTKFKAKKIWIFSQVFWISLNFRKKIWMIQIKSEWMAGLSLFISHAAILNLGNKPNKSACPVAHVCSRCRFCPVLLRKVAWAHGCRLSCQVFNALQVIQIFWNATGQSFSL